MSRDHLINETLDGGRYRLLAPLQLGPYRKLYIAAKSDAPEEQFLASVVTVARTPSPEAMREHLGYLFEGAFELSFIGHFDLRGDNQDELTNQQQNWAMLERATPGHCLRALLREPIGEDVAIALGVSVGRILLRAAEQGVMLYDVRPESIWARLDGTGLRATGLTARSEALFQHQAKGWSQILFAHHYNAPEQANRSSKSLTFTLATMIAEWVLGKYPFPAPGPSRLNNQSWQSPALPGSPGVAKLMQQAFAADPADRPDLEEFLTALDDLRAQELPT